MQLDHDRQVSSFDIFTAYDAGADQVLSFGGVELDDLTKLVHGAIFTRRGEDLKNSAIFISGTSVSTAEAMLKMICEQIFFGDRRVSIMADPNGSNTTAAAAVIKIKRAVTLQNKRSVILAGTGPVGIRAAALLARENNQVILTSRRLDKAQSACKAIKDRFNLDVQPMEITGESTLKQALDGTHIVLAVGAAGYELLPEDLWVNNPTIEVVADTNAVPPFGIGGIESIDDGAVRHQKIVFGALGIGNLKNALHRSCVARLFERHDLVLDIEEIYQLGNSLQYI